MTSSRTGWGKSVTWGTIAEAVEAAKRSQQLAARRGWEIRAVAIYQTARGRYSLNGGHRCVFVVDPAPELSGAEGA